MKRGLLGCVGCLPARCRWPGLSAPLRPLQPGNSLPYPGNLSVNLTYVNFLEEREMKTNEANENRIEIEFCGRKLQRLGAIYEIDAGEKSYYACLLNCDLYGIFAPLSGEVSEESFENTPQLKERD